MPAGGLLITRSNIHELTSDDILSFNSKKHWHKFILENGGLFDKETILQAVLESITPFDLVPVKYTVTGNDAYFLARNCGQAIEKFCLNLLLPIQLKDPPGEVKMTIQTCSISIDEYKVNMQFHLKKAIQKRYDDSREGFINLSSFHREPELYEVLFCPLSKPRFLVYVLSILKRILKVTAIDLSHNDIENLKPLEVLHDFEGLVFLDLSNNKIMDPGLPDLLEKVVPALQELNLSSNPICNTFNTEIQYLKWITEKNHSVRKLDGLWINNGLPNHQVYLCSDKAWQIVNDFLAHYFNLYDGNRKALEHTYGKNAMFSITCGHLPLQSPKDFMLECYKSESNNLVRVKDESKVRTIHFKSKNIIKSLCRLPTTEHDPYSFKVDVLFYKDPFIIIVVSGVFKDFQGIVRIRSFNRTFALHRVASDEFKITNDLYHVTNASVDEVNSSFVHPKPNSQRSGSFLRREEEQNFVRVVSRLTEMNFEYSRRYLEECSWNVKKTLEIFMENYQSSNIPQEAFAEEFPT